MPPKKAKAASEPSEDIPTAAPIDNTTFAATKMVAMMAAVVEGRGPQARAVASVRECQRTGTGVRATADRTTEVPIPEEILEDLVRISTNYPVG